MTLGNRRGMFTIEVLISIFILFLVVTLSATSSKFLNQILRQQDRYKEIYSVVLSLKDKISAEICSTKHSMVGEFNGLEYHVECSLLKELRAFEKDYDFEEGKEISGNTGMYLFQLYNVKLEIVKYNYSVNYLINRYQQKIQ